MLSKLAKRRLGQLIEFMSKVPKEYGAHFHMKSWVMHNGNWANVIGNHGIKKAADVDQEKLIECGMSACALGWGATIPSFKRAGLKLRVKKDGWSPGVLEPVYKGAADMDAAEKFFDIDEELAVRLFGPDNDDRTQREWAKRAKALVRKWPL